LFLAVDMPHLTPRVANRLVEDEVKRRYSMFLTALEGASRDPLEFVKERALRTASRLLAAKPEGEARLLGAMVRQCVKTAVKRHCVDIGRL
jgi:molybdopterin-guanine dinucleotide biosynthesis protein A